MNEFAVQKGKPDETSAKFLRVTWRRAWEMSRCVYTSLIYTGYPISNTEHAILGVFERIVEYVMDADSEELLEDLSGDLKKAVKKYLACRGVAPPDVPQEGGIDLNSQYYHPYGTEILLKYKHDGRPCGPLSDNETNLAFAVTGESAKHGRKLRAAAKAGDVFVLQLKKRRFEVYFRSMRNWHVAIARLESPEKILTDI